MGRGRPLGGTFGFVRSGREATDPVVSGREGAEARGRVRDDVTSTWTEVAQIGKLIRAIGDCRAGEHVPRRPRLHRGEHRTGAGARQVRRRRCDPDFLPQPTDAPPDEADPPGRSDRLPGGDARERHRTRDHPRKLSDQPRGPDDNTLTYSRDAFVEELERAQLLGVRDVIFHPGSHMGRGEAYAIRMIAASLDWCFEHANAPDVFAVLENTAGAGTLVGYRVEQLGAMMKGAAHSDRLGVCVDTCHTFAAGYDFRTRDGYEALLRTIDETVGVGRIRAFHLNDSVGDLGSKLDRHEDIGKGKLGK